ncbi:DUF418 domain-containing protein [Parasphingopyxis marina]|uniref:DUF418 domain-containing protein n=1 Tax=Parasphingopyxis marina TaxID=2761622 RepID=A0A842HXB8_9SPHN|nr:DUF418 domain-containing protein [Parasphingopyxis marina]MBC2776939.1 DUF418 domain-containing protein [Parasphingopyxis marina]
MTDTRSALIDSRHLSLDVIRGIAVMGILLMNIVAFAMPFQAYMNPLAYGDPGPADLAVWATNFVLADGKMRGLFSLLFGASMLLVVQRAEARGESPVLTHYQRMSWLLFFGVIHAYGIWFGDILMLYAVVGMIAFLFRNMETHKLLTLGLVLIGAQAALVGVATHSIWTLARAAAAPGAEADTIAAWTSIAEAIGPLPPVELARELALFQGGYLGILAERTGPDFWQPIAANGFAAPETLGLMLAGMAGLKSGFLTGEWRAAAYARIARIGYLIGLPLQIGLALLLMRAGFDPVAIFFYDSTLQVIANPPLIAAHAALILYWVKSAQESALMARIAAAGRAAFTNYLGTSLICTTIFYGYGLGLYGELGRAPLYLVVLGVWAAILLWSKPWLDHFRYGPLEWLWRSLARRQLQPIRKNR